MFPFNSKPEVLEHLYALVPGFNLSSKEFYASVEQDLRDRKVPGLRTSQVEYAEGGVLSDTRLYLHFVRERLTFDICAAPFGTAYFFSCRFAETPCVVHLWQIIVLTGALFIGGIVSFSLSFRIFGIMVAFVWPGACLTALVIAIYVMRNAVAMGLNDVDAALLRIPVVNDMYEAWFRKDSYYRQDTRRMYIDTIKDVVKLKIEEVTGAKGITLVTYQERSPVFEDLYRSSTVELGCVEDAPA